MKMMVGFAVLLVGSLVCGCATTKSSSSQTGRFVRVVSSTGVDEQTRKKAVLWLGRNGLPARDDGAQAFPKSGLPEIARQALPSSNDLARLVLVNDGATDCLKALYVTNGVSVLDVHALRRVGANSITDQNRFECRLCGEVMRGVAESLGMPPCPAFVCCLMPCESERALDSRGYNLCPPCAVKFEQVLCARGVEATIGYDRTRKPDE